jgi:hypothetical protein
MHDSKIKIVLLLLYYKPVIPSFAGECEARGELLYYKPVIPSFAGECEARGELSNKNNSA